jgi:hypothetical protein
MRRTVGIAAGKLRGGGVVMPLTLVNAGSV